jgi:hypothetical protein
MTFSVLALTRERRRLYADEVGFHCPLIAALYRDGTSDRQPSRLGQRAAERRRTLGASRPNP